MANQDDDEADLSEIDINVRLEMAANNDTAFDNSTADSILDASDNSTISIMDAAEDDMEEEDIDSE